MRTELKTELQIVRHILLFCGLLAAALGAHAASDASKKPSSNECVFVRSIHDFKALDRNHLVIWAPGRRNAYLVETAGGASDLKFAHRLALVDRNGDGRLCGYGMDRIVVADFSYPFPATVMGVTRLDAQRIAQLEEKYNVRLTRQRPETSGEAPRS